MTADVPYKPATYHTVSPYLVVADARGLIRFLVKVFDAQVLGKMIAPDDTIAHADLLVGDSHIMIGQAGDSGPFPGMLHLYLLDCDSTFQRALDAGATPLREPRDEFYGDRMAGVIDPFGNQWWLATHIEDVSEEEVERRARQFSEI